MSFKVGDKIGDYQIVGILGAGGMGRVYKVQNLISDRVDAMKVLLPDLAHEPELADRFVREIKVLASLNHPNIAGLHTALRLENQLLMIMEFVQGITFEEKLKSGAFPVADAVEYASQVLSALGYAHAQGVIHRDIKPANIMLTHQNAVKLMDFGIAKSKTDRKLTLTGTTMGSLFYMPPEQVQGLALDARSDLYSFGVSLYEMVTGSRPFKGQSDYDLMVAQLQKAPLPPIEIQPELPKALNDLIMTALEKDPAKRFQSAEAFRFALKSVQGLLANLPVASPQAVAPSPAGEAAGSSAVPSATAVGGQPAGQPSGPPLQPTMPFPGPVAAAQPPAGPSPPAPRSSRGWHIALVALVAVAVIALGATRLPHLLKARGGAGQSAPTAEVSSGNPQSPPQQESAPNAGETSPASESTSALSDPKLSTSGAQGVSGSSADSTAGGVPASTVPASRKTKAIRLASDAVNNSPAPAPSAQDVASNSTNPPTKLWLDPAARLFIVVSSISIKPDGSLKFRGKLLLPVPQLGPVPLDRGAEVIGAGKMSGGQTTLAVTELVVEEARYTLKGGSGAVRGETPGGGGGVHFDRSQLLDLWPLASAVYEKAPDLITDPQAQK